MMGQYWLGMPKETFRLTQNAFNEEFFKIYLMEFSTD